VGEGNEDVKEKIKYDERDETGKEINCALHENF
jgi:hypothetical protein